MSTFARWKGHRFFWRRWRDYLPRRTVRGYIIGGPIYQTEGSQWSLEELREQANRLGLTGRVGFTGFLKTFPARCVLWTSSCTASTQPEPFGMVIIEGMACGKAVIASQAGGAAELFTDGENALGHPPGDASALARQIARLAGDKELRNRLGKSGRATAERLYHGQRLAQELTAVYRELVGSAPIARHPQRCWSPRFPPRANDHRAKSLAESSRVSSTPVKVLHVNSGNLYGGVETILVTLARRREQCQGMEPHFALCHEGRLSQELLQAGVSGVQLGQCPHQPPLDRLARPPESAANCSPGNTLTW